MCAEHVERFGQQGGEVVVCSTHGNATGRDTLLPKGTRLARRILPQVQRQPHTQSAHGLAMVLRLAASLGGFSSQAGRLVLNDDGRFHLVPMLPARTTTPCSLDRAIGQQAFYRQLSRMRHRRN